MTAQFRFFPAEASQSSCDLAGRAVSVGSQVLAPAEFHQTDGIREFADALTVPATLDDGPFTAADWSFLKPA